MLSFLFTTLALLPFYLLGTFPSGYLLAKYYGVDITSQGSGNVGATNLARIVGKKAGILTLLLDSLKGWLAVTLGYWIAPHSTDFAMCCGVAAVLGHCFSIPGYLKGGKGVATGLGVLLGISALLGLVSLAVFALICGVTKRVAPASLGAAIVAPVQAMISGFPDSVSAGLVVIAIVICWRHRENIARLAQGNEPKFSPGQ